MSFTAEFEDNLQARRFRHRSILLFVILATLPFYIVGAILLGIAPSDEANVSENPSQPPPNASTQGVNGDTTATLSGSATVTLNPTLGLGTLPPTPFQFRTPTRFVLPTQPPPTATTAPSLTLAASVTPQPSATATPQGNRPPVFNTAPPDQGLAVGETVTVNLSFSDPDGDTVSMSAVSNNTGVATISGATLTSFNISGNSAGNAIITVTLSDGKGGTAEDTIAVTVTATATATATATVTIATNANPVFNVEPLDIIVEQGDSELILLQVSDPDGDPITLTVTPATLGLATITIIDGSSFTVLGNTVGSTTAVIRLQDGKGGSAERTVNLSVVAASSP